MGHYSCCTTATQLTRREEAMFTNWFVGALAERPEDFRMDTYSISDSKTGIGVWFANYVSIYSPRTSANFRLRYKWKIEDAIHRWRHRQGSVYMNELKELMATVPTPSSSIRIPRDEFDTSPQVAKLKAMVNRVAADGEYIAYAGISLILGGLSCFLLFA